MSKFSSIDLKDKYRALLTDVLPYELPIWFDNSCFYKLCRNNDFQSKHQNIELLVKLKKERTYIPLEYKISRGSGSSPRSLAIMHPFMQLEVCDFYEEHNNLIKYYATRSPHSLRYPYRLARKFYDKDETDSKASIRLDVDGYESKTASSYFKYKSIAFLYNFFEGYEYHRLEKRFSNMLQVDIAKCFPSIYTHSISWATKSKRVAKQNLRRSKGSFDASFDSLMQNTNYNETNGIIIGPEISRIFAEIILQKIDLNVVKAMQDIGFYIGEDYQFKRYVDDYFIFFNNDEIKTSFIKSLENGLLEYKLYLNEAKTEVIKRPFVTKISLAKHSIKKQLTDFFNERYTEVFSDEKAAAQDEEIKIQDKSKIKIKPCYNPGKIANQAIATIKYSFFDYKIDYHSVSNYLMTIIEKNMKRFFQIVEKNCLEIDSPLEDKLETTITNWILVDLDILFFVHAMDLRIRPTDRLARYIIKIIDNISFLSKPMQYLIQQKVFDGIRFAIDIATNNRDVNGVETLNLLTILGELPDTFSLQESTLKIYQEKIQGNSHAESFYFLFVTIMMYIKDKEEFSKTREAMINGAVLFVRDHPDGFTSTEFFILFFEFLACPYISIAIKEDFFEIATEQEITNKSRLVFNFYIQNGLFVDWENPDFLRSNLEKKKFTFAYG